MCITEIQMNIINNFYKMKNLKTIYMFAKNDIYDFWFVLSESNRDLQMEYIRKFIETEEEYTNYKLDFMVLEEEQLDTTEMPTPNLTFNLKNGCELNV